MSGRGSGRVSGLRTWFDARSQREKRLIVLAVALTALTLVWAGVIIPVGDALSSSRARHGDAVIRLAETQAQVDTLKRFARARAPLLPGGLDAAVRSSADAAGLPVQALNLLGPDRVQVGIAAARGGALLAWVSSLERRGLLVETMRLTDNGDRTVKADMTIRTRAK